MMCMCPTTYTTYLESNYNKCTVKTTWHPCIGSFGCMNQTFQINIYFIKPRYFISYFGIQQTDCQLLVISSQN